MPTKDDSSVTEFDVKEDDAVENDSQEDVDENDVDDNANEDTTDDQTSDDTSDEDDADENDDETEDSEAEFEKKYAHLKGDNPEEYAKSLEDAYGNSSKEAQKLLREKKALEDQIKTLKGDSDNKGADENVDPAIAYARAEMTRQMDEDWDAWADTHPEVTTDPALREEVLTELGVQADVYLKRTGKQIRMSEALRRTAAVLGLDNNSEEKTVAAAKGQAATGKRSGAPKKKASSSDVSDKALQLGEKMFNLSKEDILKYNKK